LCSWVYGSGGFGGGSWGFGIDASPQHDNMEWSQIEDNMQSITADVTEPNEALGKKQKTPDRYQAIGTIEGILEVNDLNHTLKVGEYSYPIRVRNKVFEKHQVGQLQYFRVYPHFKKGRLFFLVKGIVESPPSMSFILRGHWEIYNEEPRLIG
jgi:hypothetical protein